MKLKRMKRQKFAKISVSVAAVIILALTETLFFYSQNNVLHEKSDFAKVAKVAEITENLPENSSKNKKSVESNSENIEGVENVTKTEVSQTPQNSTQTQPATTPPQPAQPKMQSKSVCDEISAKWDEKLRYSAKEWRNKAQDPESFKAFLNSLDQYTRNAWQNPQILGTYYVQQKIDELAQNNCN